MGDDNVHIPDPSTAHAVSTPVASSSERKSFAGVLTVPPDEAGGSALPDFPFTQTNSSVEYWKARALRAELQAQDSGLCRSALAKEVATLSSLLASLTLKASGEGAAPTDSPVHPRRSAVTTPLPVSNTPLGSVRMTGGAGRMSSISSRDKGVRTPPWAQVTLTAIGLRRLFFTCGGLVVALYLVLFAVLYSVYAAVRTGAS